MRTHTLILLLLPAILLFAACNTHHGALRLEDDDLDEISHVADNGLKAKTSLFKKGRWAWKKGTTKIGRFCSYSWRILRPTCLTRSRVESFKSEEEVNLAEMLGMSDEEFFRQQQDAENNNQPVEAERQEEDDEQPQRTYRPRRGEVQGRVAFVQRQRQQTANGKCYEPSP